MATDDSGYSEYREESTEEEEEELDRKSKWDESRTRTYRTIRTKYSFHKYQQLVLVRKKATYTRIKLPKKARDRSGMQYGYLVVLYPVSVRNNIVIWLCECECGETILRGSDNLRIKNKNASCGCKLHNKKLTREQVVEIKLMLGTHTYVEIARMYGVSPDAIGDIGAGKNWKGV